MVVFVLNINKLRFVLLNLFAFLFVFPFVLKANWEEANGPYIAGIGQMELSKGQLLALSNNISGSEGFYYSTDFGATWSSLVDSVFFSSINHHIDVFKIVGADIYIGSTNNVFRSSDTGKTWQKLNNDTLRGGYGNSPSQFINFIDVCDTFLFVAAQGLLYRTSLKSPHLDTSEYYRFKSPIECLFVCGSNIFADVFGDHFYRSSDYGQSWKAADTSFQQWFPFAQISNYAVKNNVIYIGSPGAGISRSFDKGLTWSPANNGLGLYGVYVNSIVISGSSVYADLGSDGLYRSTDSGSSWVLINKDVFLLGSGASVSFAADSNHLFAAISRNLNSNGLYRSDNNGLTWSECNIGFKNEEITTLLYSSNYLFAGIDRSWEGGRNPYGLGVFRSSDNGSSYTQVNNGLGNKDVHALTSFGKSIFAGTHVGVYRTDDFGEHWVKASSGIPDTAIISLASNSTAIFAGTGAGGFIEGPDGSQFPKGLGLFRSLDTGQHWSRIGNPAMDTNDITALATNGNTILAGTWNNGGVFRSTDNGSNWVNANLPIPKLTDQARITSILINGPIVLVSRSDPAPAYRSTDNGISWNSISTLSNQDAYGGFNVVKSNYFVCGASGLYRSIDNGSTWQIISSNFTKSSFLGSENVIAFSSSANGYMFVGKPENGVWRCPLSEVVPVKEFHAVKSKTDFYLDTPKYDRFNKSFAISFYVPVASNVKLEIFAISGEKISSITNQRMKSGYHDILWPLEGVAAGIYLCRATSENVSITRKFIISR
jgi:photosystem II stability/assembly factor-like uncharacterized protein